MTHRARQNPTRYQRETGEKLPRWRQKLAQYEAEGGYFVHFSNYPKTGVYPTNKYDTPTGFYAYPLSFDRISEFATDRPYAIVFKPVRARLWVLSGYSAADYSRDLKVLHAALGRFQVAEWKKQAQKKTPAGQMWNITRMLAKGSVARWTKIIYEVLGYDGVVDDCLSIIHTSEPCQAVFFDMRTGSPGSPQNEKVRIVDVLEKGKSAELERPKGIDFRGKDLTRINLRRIDLRGANLVYAGLSGADLSGMDLSAADLRSANLSGANLRGANLTESFLAGTDLSRMDLTGARLASADLRGAYLRGATLTGADLTGANLEGAVIHNANLSGAILTGAVLGGANLHAANITSASLSGVNLYGANLRHANLREADLSRAKIISADLRETDLSRANLSGADLRDTDLGRANLTGADLTGVAWDDDTTWPAGFKPPATSYRRPAS